MKSFLKGLWGGRGGPRRDRRGFAELVRADRSLWSRLVVGGAAVRIRSSAAVALILLGGGFAGRAELTKWAGEYRRGEPA